LRKGASDEERYTVQKLKESSMVLVHKGSEGVYKFTFERKTGSLLGRWYVKKVSKPSNTSTADLDEGRYFIFTQDKQFLRDDGETQWGGPYTYDGSKIIVEEGLIDTEFTVENISGNSLTLSAEIGNKKWIYSLEKVN
jgi:hypothetical protein